jgi:hypothetical protein
VLNEETKKTLRDFQADCELPETGELDEPTRKALSDAHRS